MTRSIRRLALAAAALPVALADASGPAHAADPMCFGTSSVTIICDPTVTPTSPVGVETYTHTEVVCLDTCREVEVTLVRFAEGGPLEVCVRWDDPGGNPQPPVCVFRQYVRPTVDPVACSLLWPLTGHYGPIFIDVEGDVYVDGRPFHDCPPYDIWG
ncbi:MAG TPA: hypothetical protein VNA20_05280 [Frankiaceae bacterium]|nr:hypothetical protein [Frankiaceae bacterium]